MAEAPSMPEGVPDVGGCLSCLPCCSGGAPSLPEGASMPDGLPDGPGGEGGCCSCCGDKPAAPEGEGDKGCCSCCGGDAPSSGNEPFDDGLDLPADDTCCGEGSCCSCRAEGGCCETGCCRDSCCMCDCLKCNRGDCCHFKCLRCLPCCEEGNGDSIGKTLWTGLQKVLIGIGNIAANELATPGAFEPKGKYRIPLVKGAPGKLGKCMRSIADCIVPGINAIPGLLEDLCNLCAQKACEAAGSIFEKIINAVPYEKVKAWLDGAIDTLMEKLSQMTGGNFEADLKPEVELQMKTLKVDIPILGELCAVDIWDAAMGAIGETFDLVAHVTVKVKLALDAEMRKRAEEEKKKQKGEKKSGCCSCLPCCGKKEKKPTRRQRAQKLNGPKSAEMK